MTGRLSGKRALVTGAGSGIGAATAQRLAAEGAAVAVVDANASAAHAVAEEIIVGGGQAIAVTADVSDEDSISAGVHRATAAFGGLTTLVANAGIELVGSDAAVHDLDLAVWRRTLDTNLTGTFLTCKHGVRRLLAGGGGSVVIVGSPTGLYGMERGAHAYSASKAGCHGLARVMANEYATRGIRVNVVLPGFIHTPINAPVLDDPAALRQTLAAIPQGRAGRPEEVAALIAFLSSDEASYSVGGYFTADGGLTAI